MKDSLRNQIPAFILTRTILNTAVRMVYPFLPAFGRGLGVDMWAVSLAVTYRSAAGGLGPFLAFIADKYGRKTGMMLGLIIATGGAVIMVAWPGYMAFVLALVLILLGNLVLIPSMQAYLSDRVPYERRARILALTEFGWSLAFIIGIPLVGLVIQFWGWQAPFLMIACLGGLLIIFLGWLLPGDRPIAGQRVGLGQNLKLILSSHPALAGLILGAAISGANELVNMVFGTWMETSFGLKLTALGVASTVIGFSELGGESLVSLLTDRLGKGRSVLIGILLNCLAAILMPTLGHSLLGALVSLSLFYVTFEFTIVSSIPLLTEVLPPARATLMAMFVASMSIGRAAGDLLAAPLYNYGILAIVCVAVVFNLTALLALRRLEKGV